MRFSRFIFLGVAAAFACVGARAQEAGDDVHLADGITAVVNEVPITQQQILQFIGPDEQRRLYDQYRDRPEVYNRSIIKISEDSTEILINRQVILHEFEASIKIPESILDDIVQDRINELIKDKYHDEGGLTRDLRSRGITKEEFKKQLREQIIIENMRNKFVPEPIISPRKVENYYVAHREDFKLEDEIKMRMIVLNKSSSEPEDQTRKRASEILSQIKGGASFAELARSYSDGSTKQDGGETGWEEVSIINKALVAELNKLKPGQYSDVIDTQTACYLLLLEDRHSAHFKSLNEVRDQIEHTLANLETDRLQKQWMDRLRKKTFVKYF